jgi:hypothetical protein
VGVTEDEELQMEKEGSEIVALLRAYYAKPVPKENNMLKFSLPGF